MFGRALALTGRVRLCDQTQHHEFGVEVSVATTLAHAKGGQFVTHVISLPGNRYDGHTVETVIPDMQARPSLSSTALRQRLSRPPCATLLQV